MGAANESERFALPSIDIVRNKAKSAIDNCRAGRAAKGASPASSSKKTRLVFASRVFFMLLHKL